MSLMATSEHAIDPITGLTVALGSIMCAVDGTFMSTCPTGKPHHSRNIFPGTDPNAPGNANPGLPYGFLSVPSTGPP